MNNPPSLTPFPPSGVVRDHSPSQEGNWLETLPTGAVVLDAQGGIAACNTEFARLHGRSAKELLGRCLWEWNTSTTDIEGLRRALLTPGPHPRHLTTLQRTSAGELRKVEFRWRPAVDGMPPRGLLVLVVGEPAEGVPTGSAEVGPPTLADWGGLVGLWEYHLEKGEVRCSQDVAALLGYADGGLPRTGEGWYSLFHPDDRKHIDAALAPIYAGEADHSVMEYRMRRKDGVYRWFLTASAGERDTDGRLISLRGTTADITNVRATQDALREREQRYSSLVETAGCAIITLGLDYRILEWNRGAEELLGWQADAVLGKNYLETCLPREWRERVTKETGQVLTGRASIGYENPVVTKNGEERVALWNSQALIDTSGNPYALVKIGQDITARKKAERALRAAQERLRFLLGTAPVVLFISRAEAPHEVLFISETIQALTGFPPEEFTRDPSFWNSLVYAEDLARIQADASRPWRAGETRIFEYRLRHREGPCHWVHSEIRLTSDANGQPAERVGFAVDISDRKKAEEALRASEERFRRLFESAPLGIVIASPTGHPIRANEAICRMLGYTEEELRGKHFLEITHPEDGHIEPPLVEKIIQGELDAVSLEKRYLHKNGSVVQASVTASVIRDADGRPLHGVVLIEDVTQKQREEAERKRLEVKLQHAQKLESLGIMAGGIAHDFNNLLTGILGYANLAAQEAPAGIRDYLEQINKAGHRAAELCEQMLAYAGRGRTVVGMVTISSLVQEMADLVRPSILPKITVGFELEPGLPPIEADGTQLRQVAMNLILNAAEAIGDRPGSILVRTGRQWCDHATLRSTYLENDLSEGNYVFLEVADDGCGMSPETRKKIFEPFFTTKFTGRGLGLAAVLGIVRGHRGAIQLESSPGQGTRFRILLPANVDSSATLRPPSNSRGPRGAILLVDDEDFIRDLGARVLEAAGYKVLQAVDGQQAVELFRERGQEICLVVLDLVMPRLNGERTLRALRQLDPDVRVLLASGYSEQEIGGSIQPKEVSGFLQKPFRPEELVLAVFKVLGVEASPSG